MAKTILITGGCRSGKSAYAQHRAESLAGSRIYVATCPVTDQEMQARIARHIEQRARRKWKTVEEQIALALAIENADGGSVILVDCLTLWVNNLMYEAEKRGDRFDEVDIEAECIRVCEVASEHSGTVIFVTNEVGMGIVPENAAARRYRDLAGRCNQTVAAAADEVSLVVAGIPMTIKGENNGVAS